MSEEIFVHYCSPTLAGIKTANLFSCRFADEKEMRDSVRRLNVALVKKGIRVLPLRLCRGWRTAGNSRTKSDYFLVTRRKM